MNVDGYVLHIPDSQKGKQKTYAIFKTYLGV